MSEKERNPEVDRMDIAYEVAERTGHSPVAALDTLKALGGILADALITHGRAEIYGFGTFRLEPRAALKGTLNGVPWETPERQEIVFEAWPTVADIVAARSGVPTY